MIDSVEDILSHGRRIDEEVSDEHVEDGVFFARRYAQVAHRLTEGRALIKLMNANKH